MARTDDCVARRKTEAGERHKWISFSLFGICNARTGGNGSDSHDWFMNSALLFRPRIPLWQRQIGSAFLTHSHLIYLFFHPGGNFYLSWPLFVFLSPLLATFASYISTFLVLYIFSPTQRTNPNYVLPPTTSLAIYLEREKQGREAP